MSYYLELLEKYGLALDLVARELREASSCDMQDKALTKRRYYGGGHPLVALTADGRRICCRCRVAKPPEAYTKNRNKRDGLDARCRECKKAVARERYRSSR